MDDRLEQVLAFANYRQTLNNQLQKLKIRTEGMLLFSKNGGNFIVGQELICFLDYLTRKGINNTALLDNNNIPVMIDNIEEFQKEITNRYFEVTNGYLKEYKEISRSRNVKSILDIKDNE